MKMQACGIVFSQKLTTRICKIGISGLSDFLNQKKPQSNLVSTSLKYRLYNGSLSS